jgi:small subunit ribosomal protein S20
MPHTTSAKKALRQTEKRNAHNRAAKKAIKLQIKKFLATLKDGTSDQKKAEYNVCAKKLDKAAAGRIIHPNLASRKKSQLAKKLIAPAVAQTTKK